MRLSYNLPGTSLFLYFQLRSSMKAYGVPWNTPLPTHPLHSILYNKAKKKELVSKLYSLFQDTSYKALPIINLWSNDLKHYFADESLNWSKIWSSIGCASKNPDHQQIHFNYIHRTYLAPRIIIKGTYMQMYWECKDTQSLHSQKRKRLLGVRFVLL